MVKWTEGLRTYWGQNLDCGKLVTPIQTNKSFLISFKREWISLPPRRSWFRNPCYCTAAPIWGNTEQPALRIFSVTPSVSISYPSSTPDRLHSCNFVEKKVRQPTHEQIVLRYVLTWKWTNEQTKQATNKQIKPLLPCSVLVYKSSFLCRVIKNNWLKQHCC